MIQTNSVAVRIGAALLLCGAFACDRPSSEKVSSEPQGSTSPQALVAPAPPAVAPATPAQTPTQPGTDVSGAQTTFDVSNLGDPGLAAVLQSLHQQVAQEAQLAGAIANTPAVKEQAQQASAFHAAAMTNYQKLFGRLGLVPRVNPVSQQIDADTASAMQALHAAHGMDFDHEYVDRQSRSLAESMQLFDRVLAFAKSPGIQDEVARNRPDVDAELRTVTQLKQSLSRGVTNMQPPPDPQLPIRRPMP